MKIRLVVTAALLLAATGVFALSSEYTEWGKGPVQYIMTKDEQAKWKTIDTDDAAKAFVDLFWARRDPTPETPRNEAHEAYDARVKWADDNFAFRNTRGSMTDRGRLVILYGQPKRIERQAVDTTTFGSTDETRDRGTWVQWVYEGEVSEQEFGGPKTTIRISDRLGNGDFRIERSTTDLTKAQARAIEKMIVNPNLTAAPVFAGAMPAAAAPRAVAASAQVTALTTAALATAVEEYKAAAKNPYEGKAFASWGEFVTPAGEYFVPVMVSVPPNAGVTADQAVTFFGVIEDESGKPVLAFEEPAKIAAAKNDLMVAKSLVVPAGKHRGIFGIAAGGKPVVLASTNMTLAGTLDKDATAISPLILAAHVEPMAEAQKPTEPFAFGGVKIIPKADKTFRKSDELWFFFELRNPGLADSITASEGTATGAPAEQLPKVQVKMDVAGKLADGTPVKRGAPLSEVNAVSMKGVPGHYGVGNSIPLESFKPGQYTFTLKVIDTVKKASYTLSDTFRVVE